MTNKDNIDLSAIISGLGGKEIGQNATTFTGLLSELNQSLEKIDKTVSYLNKWNILTPMLRLIADKAKVDIDKPLAGAIAAATPWHQMLFESLNTLSPEDALKQITDMGKELKAKTEKVIEK